jgi:ATP/maltotriose-dependent transcriptional regulator MalT
LISGQIDVGIEKLLHVLALSRSVQAEPVWEVWVLNVLGHAAVLKQDWAAGLRYHQQAVDQSRTSHSFLLEVLSHINLAEVARTTGDLRLAETHYQAAAAVSRREDSRHLEELAAFSLGRAAMLRTEHTAARFFLEALEAFLRKDKSKQIPHCLDALAVAYAVQLDQADLAARLHGAADRVRPKFYEWGWRMPLNLIPLT